MSNEKWNINTNFIACAVFAFLSVISFFQINSAYADAHHLNGIIGWLGGGILFGLIAVFFLYKTFKSSTGTGG